MENQCILSVVKTHGKSIHIGCCEKNKHGKSIHTECYSLFGGIVLGTETEGVGLPVSPVAGDAVVCPLTGVALGPAVGVTAGV